MIIRDIGELLEKYGFGAIGMDIFLDQTLESPDNQIVIFSYASRPQNLRMDEAYYNFQISVRNKSYESGYTKAVEIYNILDDGETRSHFISQTGKYIIVRVLQPPFFFKRDDLQRAYFALNIQVLTKRD